MLLPPETTSRATQWPPVWQLSSAEREALHAELPALAEALGRISRSYLGAGASVDVPELVWQRSDMAGLPLVGGPALVTELGEAGRLVITLGQPLAARCVVALLGYPTKLAPPSETLTEVDLAVLRLYLVALADNLVRMLFRKRAEHQLLASLPPGKLGQGREGFTLLFRLVIGSAEGNVVMTAPTEAWRVRVASDRDAGQPALGLGELQQAPVKLAAILPGVSLSLVEVATMEPGDVIPLPRGEEMVVHLQADDCVVATGRAGARGGQLGVRLLRTEIFKETETPMSEDTTRDQQLEAHGSARELISRLCGEDGAGLESLSAIPVNIQLRLGEVAVPLAELLELRVGSVVVLDKSLDERVEVLAGDKVVAFGEIVAVEDQLGVRILQLAASEPA